MSAARDELAEVIRRQLIRTWKYGPEPGSGRADPADVILAAADRFAADEVGTALDFARTAGGGQ